MWYKRSDYATWIFVICIVLTISSKGASANNGKAALVVPRVQEAPQLENFLRMEPAGPVEKQMAKVSGFIQQQPKDGEASSQRTDVFLGYDDKNLFVVFVAFDSEPDKVRAHMTRREKIRNDDFVQIMLDTFHDKRRAVAFAATPLGIQWDALWTEGSDFDDTFDTLWYSKGKLTDQGYLVWMAIPLKSLRFPAGLEQNWGVVFARGIRRGSFEQSFWPRVSSQIEGRLNQAATLQIKDSISPGRNVQLIPYGNYRALRFLDGQSSGGPGFTTDNVDAVAGLDAKWVIKDNLALDVTLNPDFSQVESDEPQVTVNQRFEVFFPEKRPFFLENSDIFATPINFVFTRRIADPQIGARLTGKAGPYTLGGIFIDDEAPGKRVTANDPLYGKRAFFSIFRASRDVQSQSKIGLIYAGRELGRSYNRVAGVDGRLKLNQNWAVPFMAAVSFNRLEDDSRRSDPAFDLAFNGNGRQWLSHTHFQDIGRDFRTETGFVSRLDIRDFHTFNRYRFRPEGKFLIAWGPQFFFQQVWDHDNLRLDQWYGPDLNFELTGQTELGIGIDKIRERLRPQDSSTLTRNKDFSRHLWFLEFETQFIDELSIDSNFEFGRGINFLPPDNVEPFLANRIFGNIQLSLLPTTQLRIDSDYIFSQLDDRDSGERIFKNQILRSRWNWQFNRKLSVRLIFQYDVTLANQKYTSLETTKDFNVDFLVTYLANPWTALFAGVNSNYQNLDLVTKANERILNRTKNSFLNDSRQFFVKYSYLIRL